MMICSFRAVSASSVGNISQVFPEHPPAPESPGDFPLKYVLRNRGLILFRWNTVLVVQELPEFLLGFLLCVGIEDGLQGQPAVPAAILHAPHDPPQ